MGTAIGRLHMETLTDCFKWSSYHSADHLILIISYSQLPPYNRNLLLMHKRLIRYTLYLLINMIEGYMASATCRAPNLISGINRKTASSTIPTSSSICCYAFVRS